MANVSRKGIHLNFDRMAHLGYVDPVCAVSRASSGTVVNMGGGVDMIASDKPRFNKSKFVSGLTVTRGLLVEDQRTNIVTNSTGNMPWTLHSGAVVTPNAALAPDGTMTATLIDVSACSVGMGCYLPFGATDGARYTSSTFTKAFSATGNASWADPSYGPNWDTQALPVASDWTRSYVVGSGSGNGSTGFWFKNSAGGVNKFYIWGLQIEPGRYPTSLIPTTSGNVTRATDYVGVIANPCYNYGIRSEQGTLVLDFSPHPASLAQGDGVIDGCFFQLGKAGGFPQPGITCFAYNPSGVKHPYLGVGESNYYDIISTYIDWLGVDQLARYRIVLSWENGIYQLSANGVNKYKNLNSGKSIYFPDEMLVGRGSSGNTLIASAMYHEVRFYPQAFPEVVVTNMSKLSQNPL